MKLKSHTPKNTPIEHMMMFYRDFEDMKKENYDGMIITGAPVETLDFEEVEYWDEITSIFEWAHTHVTSTLYICWAAQAGLYHFYDIPKHPLSRKMFGIFKQYPTDCHFPIFRGFDDVLKLASTTVSKGYLCWVWIEEAFELADENDFDKLNLSVPRGAIPDTLFKQTTLTFNPWSAEHWLKKKFFDQPDEDVSTYSTNYMINEWLDDTDRAVFERMKSENPRKYDVAGLGNWGISEGLVFENWRSGVIEITKEDAWKWRDFFGLDYGYTNDPTAFIAFKVNPIDRLVYIYDEFYSTKMLNCDIAEEIKRKGYAKERIRADCAEPKSNEDLRRLGISRILPSEKGRDSILNGIDRINGYKITVDPFCKNTLAELSAYIYDEKHTVNGHRMPIDTQNHLMDALRYGFYDVRFFHPVDPKSPKARPTDIEYENKKLSVTAEDMRGGWV